MDFELLCSLLLEFSKKGHQVCELWVNTRIDSIRLRRDLSLHLNNASQPGQIAEMFDIGDLMLRVKSSWDSIRDGKCDVTIMTDSPELTRATYYERAIRSRVFIVTDLSGLFIEE